MFLLLGELFGEARFVSLENLQELGFDGVRRRGLPLQIVAHREGHLFPLARFSDRLRPPSRLNLSEELRQVELLAAESWNSEFPSVFAVQLLEERYERRVLFVHGRYDDSGSDDDDGEDKLRRAKSSNDRTRFTSFSGIRRAAAAAA